MKKLLIRFDDICPTMDWQLWNDVEKLLNQYSIKPLIGVIPECQDPDLQIDASRIDFWDWLSEKQVMGYTIAMHGVNHVFRSPCHGILNHRMNSEFAGVPLQIQYDLIKHGKEILESHGIFTDVFFAPAHSYDENTVIALSRCGFKYISDGKSRKPYKWHGITFLPCRNSGSVSDPREIFSTSIYHVHEWRITAKNARHSLVSIISDNCNSVCDFETYCSQSIGNTLVQRCIEVTYVKKQYIKSCVYKLIKNLFK